MSSFIEKEKKARRAAIWIIGGMIGIWIVLSIFSFTDSAARKRPDTTQVTFAGQTALRGKQVFQAYNCMDCHTMVGNGAYFAPDLTKIYDHTGPAWLKAYLSSPGTYPTRAIVNVNLQELIQSGAVGQTTLDDYLAKYPGAKSRVEERGGVQALMPNLGFSADDIKALIAFLKYSSKLNTGGWPPKVIASQSVIQREAEKLESESGLIKSGVTGELKSPNSSGAGGAGSSPIALGKEQTINLGCAACHSVDGSKLVGPSFKGLFGSQVSLDGGRTVTADTAYIRKSILEPNADIVKGFPKSVMPAFGGTLTDEQISDIIQYIKSLK